MHRIALQAFRARFDTALLHSRARGGTGSHAGLRTRCQRWRGGSTPSERTHVLSVQREWTPACQAGDRRFESGTGRTWRSGRAPYGAVPLRRTRLSGASSNLASSAIPSRPERYGHRPDTTVAAGSTPAGGTMPPWRSLESARRYERRGRRFESCWGYVSGRGAAWWRARLGAGRSQVQLLSSRPTGCSAAWSARRVRDAEAAGSSPASPTHGGWRHGGKTVLKTAPG